MIRSNPEMASFFSSPRYRYISRDGSRDRYFYTTDKVNHKGKPRFVAGIYRFLKSKNSFKLVKRAGFARKKRAILWAEKARDKEAEAKKPKTSA